jgi:hypothetical protein
MSSRQCDRSHSSFRCCSTVGQLKNCKGHPIARHSSSRCSWPEARPHARVSVFVESTLAQPQTDTKAKAITNPCPTTQLICFGCDFITSAATDRRCAALFA